MSVPRPRPAVRLGDPVIALFLLAVFILGYLAAQEWPFRAQLFPQMVTAAGIALALFKLVGFAAAARSGRAGTPQPVSAGGALDQPGASGEDDEDDRSLEYVFGTAGRREWLSALGWILGFFVSLWLLGVFITVPLFAFTYLRFAGNTSWLGAGIYAAVAGGVIWSVFGYLLAVPMPAGIF